LRVIHSIGCRERGGGKRRGMEGVGWGEKGMRKEGGGEGGRN